MKAKRTPIRKGWGKVTVEGVRLVSRTQDHAANVEVRVKGRWVPVIESSGMLGPFRLEIIAHAIHDRLDRKR